MNAFLAIEPGERAPQKLRRKALDLVQEAIERLGEIPSEGHKAVHDARRRLKELRALALLLGASSAELELFRDAGRLLCAARDSKAVIEAFDRLRESFSGEWSPRRYARIRRALSARTKDMPEDGAIEHLRSVLLVERGEIAAWTVDEMTRSELWSAIQRSRRRCRRAMGDAVGQASPVRFHRWRKRTKTLWYQAQVLSFAGLADLEDDCEKLRRLSRTLGDHHDLVLIDHLCHQSPEIFGTLPYVNSFRTFIARRLRQLEVTAEALGSELFAEKARAWKTRVAASERHRAAAKRPELRSRSDSGVMTA